MLDILIPTAFLCVIANLVYICSKRDMHFEKILEHKRRRYDSD
jgi:hypothetical protein